MQEVEAKQFRSFGLLMGGILAVFSLWPTLFRNQVPRLWTFVLAGLLVVLALILPRSLGPIYRVWMAIGHVLGWINTKVVLTVVFYAMFTPVRVIMSLLGKDPMCRKFEQDANDYRVIREPRPSSHMTRQF